MSKSVAADYSNGHATGDHEDTRALHERSKPLVSRGISLLREIPITGRIERGEVLERAVRAWASDVYAFLRDDCPEAAAYFVEPLPKNRFGGSSYPAGQLNAALRVLIERLSHAVPSGGRAIGSTASDLFGAARVVRSELRGILQTTDQYLRGLEGVGPGRTVHYASGFRFPDHAWIRYSGALAEEGDLFARIEPAYLEVKRANTVITWRETGASGSFGVNRQEDDLPTIKARAEEAIKALDELLDSSPADSRSSAARIDAPGSLLLQAMSPVYEARDREGKANPGLDELITIGREIRKSFVLSGARPAAFGLGHRGEMDFHRWNQDVRAVVALGYSPAAGDALKPAPRIMRTREAYVDVIDHNLGVLQHIAAGKLR